MAYSSGSYTSAPSDRSATDWAEEWKEELNQPVQYKPTTGQTQTGTTTQTSTTEFVGERPEYEKPTWDESEIRKLSRKIAAPNIRQLRQQVQQVVAKHYENPNVRSMMLRSALQGYGIGLGGVLSSAGTQARSEYTQRYSFDVREAMAKYQSAWNEYMASAEKTTTSTTTGTTQNIYDTGAPSNYMGYNWQDWTGPAVLNPYTSRTVDVWSKF